MKKNDTKYKISLDSTHPLYYSLELIKIGHTALSGLMFKSPAATSIAISNDAILNISISTTAQGTPLGKSVIEFIGSFAAGAVCTLSGGYLSGTLAATTCGVIGGEISGKLYDIVAKTNDYGNAEDFIKEYYKNNTTLNFEEILSRYEAINTLQEGDYAYVNSPVLGSQLYTKSNGELQKVLVPPPDPSFFENLHVEKSSLKIQVGDENDLSIKIDSLLVDNNVPDYDVIIAKENNVKRTVYSNLSLSEFLKTYELSLDKVAEPESTFQNINSHKNIFAVDPGVSLLNLDREITGNLAINKALNLKLYDVARSYEETGHKKESQYILDQLEESAKLMREMQPKIAIALAQARNQARECVRDWFAEREKPEIKLSRFGFSKQEILSNPIKSQYIVDNYDGFQNFYQTIKERCSIELSFDDIPNDLSKLQLMIDYSDSIVEFIENELISTVNDLPNDTNLLETLLENEMAIVHLKELKVITKLSEVEEKIIDLSILKDYGLTSDKAAEILESQGMHEDALRAKFWKELSLMTEEEQNSTDTILKILESKGDMELLEFCKSQIELNGDDEDCHQDLY